MNSNNAIFLAEVMKYQDDGVSWSDMYRGLVAKYKNNHPMLKMLKELHQRGVGDEDLVESLAIMAESVSRVADIRTKNYENLSKLNESMEQAQSKNGKKRWRKRKKG